MVILSYQMTITRMNYKQEMDGTLVIQTLRLEGTLLIWATPSTGSLYKNNERKVCSSPVCPHLVSTSIPSSGVQQTS